MTARNATENATADLIAKHKEYIWPCAATYYENPLALERGEGMHVWDSEGNRYLDCFGGVLTTSIGHARPEVVKAVSEQIGKIAHTSTLYINQPQADLAEKVATITPGNLKKSFFTNSGTEADETAMVLARIYTGRTEIVALRHAYHGRSVTNMTASGHAPWKHGPSIVPGIVHAHAPYCYRCPFNLKPDSCAMECARDVEELIQTSTAGQIAAFIAEPIMGVVVIITPPKDYFKVVTEIVRRYGGIFICDEVQTGWGRTGDHWCGIEHWNVEPEIMTFAKSVASGFPVGVTIANPEVADAWTGLSLSTFGGNPISMVAVDATLDVMERENTPKRSAERGRQLREALEELKKRFAFIGDVRGMGLMQGLELVEDRKTKEPSPKKTLALMEAAKRQGLLIGKGGLYGNVIRIAPSMLITKADIDDGCKRMERALAEIQ